VPNYRKHRKKFPPNKQMKKSMPRKKQKRNEFAVSNSITVIIDGYNVIFSDEHLGHLGKRNIETARKVLFRTAQAWLARNDTFPAVKLLVIVFDNTNEPYIDGLQKFNDKKIKSYFTKMKEADDWIIHQVLSNAHNKYLVITNDREIILKVRGQNCRIISPDKFIESARQLKKDHRSIKHPSSRIKNDKHLTERQIKKINDELLEIWCDD